MENLNAEQVKKALECCLAEIPRCEECPRYDACREGVGFDIPKCTLALITSQEQRIKELTEQNERLRVELAERPPKLVITKKINKGTKYEGE